MANTVEIADQGDGKLVVTIRSDGERDLSAVVPKDELEGMIANPSAYEAVARPDVDVPLPPHPGAPDETGITEQQAREQAAADDEPQVEPESDEGDPEPDPEPEPE